MPGLGTPSNPITPGRKTHIIYDAADEVMIARGFGLTFTARQVVAQARKLEGVTYIPGAGIQLTENTEALRNSFWGIGSDEGVYTATDAFIAPAFEQRYLNRTKPEVAGGFTGSTLPPVSGIAFVRRQAASENLTADATRFRLEADQDAFPGPVVPGNALVMDRVFASKNPHVANQPIGFLVAVYGASGQRGLLHQIAYFNGPAGETDDFVGYGQYAAAMFDGKVLLYERGHDPGSPSIATWTLRATKDFPDAPNGNLSSSYVLLVRPIAKGSRRIIEFRLVEWSADSHQCAAPQIFELMSIAGALITSMTVNTYSVPSKPHQPLPTIPAAIRLDVPRPFRSLFRVKRMPLNTEGMVQDFKLGLLQGDFAYADTLRIEWYYDAVGPVAVDFQLKERDGAPIAATRSGVLAINGQAGRWAEYDFPSDYDSVAWKGDFTFSGDSVRTATLTDVRLLKVPTTGSYAGRNIEGGETRKDSLSIIGGGSDPSTSSAGWQVADPENELELLMESGSIPVRIETEIDPEDPAQRVVLFRGYIEDTDSVRRRKRTGVGIERTNPHPFPIGYDHSVKAIGRWLRVQETRDASMFTFHEDPNAGVGVPYKVTDALKVLLKRCGFDGDMVDIPDDEIRLFPVWGASADDYVVRSLSDLSQAIQYYARDYLGGAIIEDESGGEHGRWKLVQPGRAPYTYRAYFTTAEPPSGRAFGLGAYDPTEIEAGDFMGVAHEEATVPTVPVIGLRRRIKRPVANRITVSGTGMVNNVPSEHLMARYINPNSYRHHPDSTAGPGPDNPDWLGREVPLWYVDPMLQTDAAVTFVAARLYEILAFGKTDFRIEAPLAFLPHEDGGGKMRKMRFGDPVVVFDGETEWPCMVRDCTPMLKRDSAQMAVYEIEQVRF